MRGAGEQQHVVEGGRLLKEIQVFALQILGQRDERRAFHIRRDDDAGHRFQPKPLGGAVASFAADQLVFFRADGLAVDRQAARGAFFHRERLDKAVAADAFRKRVERLVVEIGARLHRIGRDLVDGYVADLPVPAAQAGDVGIRAGAGFVRLRVVFDGVHVGQSCPRAIKKR